MKSWASQICGLKKIKNEIYILLDDISVKIWSCLEERAVDFFDQMFNTIMASDKRDAVDELYHEDMGQSC